MRNRRIFSDPIPATFPNKPFQPIQQLRRAKAVSKEASSTPECSIEVHVGVFFDGTNNNMQRDKLSIPDVDARSHSNVVVLYDAFADKRQYHYRIYIPGVGTPFPEVGEITETSAGKALAKGGGARIYWGMIQTINAIHRSVNNNAPLVQDDKATRLITSHLFLGAQSIVKIPPVPDSVRRQAVFERLGKELAYKLKKKKSPTIRLVNLSIFGFSRGAAEARTFCNWMTELCQTTGKGQTFFGVPLRFQFLGLLDTVASVGLADSSPVPNDGGFMSWADGTMELPPAIEQCVHYTAAHEIRKSFPLSTTRKSQCSVKEFIYPGAHSDVGGGYAPGEQGKGKTRPDLLSQVPLIHMYRAARAAGVPLADDHELGKMGRAETIKDLKISSGLIKHFNAYREHAPGGGEIKAATRKHMRQYWRWRLSVGDKFTSLSSYQAASAQDKEDLAASEMDFRRDVAQAERDEAAIKYRKEHPFSTAIGDAANNTARMFPGGMIIPAKTIPVLSTAEREVLADKRSQATVPPIIGAFFDQYVHDSHASFYLAGPASKYEREQKIKAVERKLKEGEELNGFERRIAELQETNPGAFPTMTDADYDDLLEMDGLGAEATVKWLGMSATRRESEGHVRERVIFDKS